MGFVCCCICHGIIKKKDPFSDKRMVLTLVLSAIQILVLAAVLCPVAVLYVLGLYISAGVSLWRLIEHDFGNADGGANLKPALQVLYILAVAQGMLFGYKKMHSFGAKIGLAGFVADKNSVDKKIVADYLEDTVAGCEKDPSFATGRNFVTYAVDLMMEAKSNDGFTAGVRVLGAAIKDDYAWGQKVLAKHLLTQSASLSHMIQRLLETMGPRSPYSKEIREHAARIVALVAGGIRLEQFPQGIQCISSLMINPFEEHSVPTREYDERDSRLPNEYERHWLLDEYERYYLLDKRKSLHSTDRKSPESDSNPLDGDGLVLQGLCILDKLTVEEDNCRVISNTEGLLSKITIPLLIFEKRHGDHHYNLSSVAEKSLELTGRLMAALGETGTNLRPEISKNIIPIVSTIKNVLQCLECGMMLKKRAVEVLLYLSVDTSSIMASGSSSRMFIWILLYIFLFKDDLFCSYAHWMKESSDIRRLVGEKLSGVLSSNHELSAILPLQIEGSATSMLQSVRVFVRGLTKALVDAGNNTDRAHAAQILEHLCQHYRKHDEYYEEVTQASVDVMPKVIREILGCGSTSEEIQAATEANDMTPVPDLEKGGVSEDHGQENISSSHRQMGGQNGDNNLRKALVSLCRSWSWWYKTDFKDIASKICSEQGKTYKSFDLLFRKEYDNIKKGT